jgi:hypothetical protein
MKVKGYIRDDGSVEYVEDGSMPSQDTPEERIAELEHKLLQVNQRLYDAEYNLERLANIVQTMQEQVINGINSLSGDISVVHANWHDHVKSWHSMLIIGNKEDKHEDNIS